MYIIGSWGIGSGYIRLGYDAPSGLSSRIGTPLFHLKVIHTTKRGQAMEVVLVMLHSPVKDRARWGLYPEGLGIGVASPEL